MDELSRSEYLRVYAENHLHAPVAVVDRKVIYKERVYGVAADAELPLLPEGMRKHTDAHYYRARGIRGGVLVVAVTLHDVSAGNGATVVWPGTHVQRFETIDAGIEGPVVPDVHAPDDQGVELHAPAGSILLWDARIVHSSGMNRSGSARRLAIFAYAAASLVPA
jgi:ectoine hydroxylase-related dioxygenase (phytanoyl-CoA dioxygenase family)